MGKRLVKKPKMNFKAFEKEVDKLMLLEGLSEEDAMDKVFERINNGEFELDMKDEITRIAVQGGLPAFALLSSLDNKE